MKFLSTLLRRHRMKEHCLNFEEYSLLYMINEKKSGLKDAVRTVTEARKSKPMITATLRDYTLQILLRLIKRGLLEKKRNQWIATEKAETIIKKIGPPEDHILSAYSNPSRCSSISIALKTAAMLILTAGFLGGGAFSLLAAAVILFLETMITLHPLFTSEKTEKSRWTAKIPPGLLTLALCGITIRALLLPLPLSRNWIVLGFLLFSAILALSITRFRLNVPTRRRKQLRLLFFCFTGAMMGILFIKGAIHPLPVPKSGLTFLTSLLVSGIFFLLFYFQKLTGSAFTAFPLIFLSQTSLRFILITGYAAVAALFSYSGIYHPDYISLIAAGALMFIQLFRLLQIAETKKNRRNTIELWLEERAKSARKRFFSIWVYNLLKEQQATKSEILSKHLKNYGKKKAGLHKNVNVYLDRDGFLEENLDIYLSNLMFDREIIIEKDRFTIPACKKGN